MSLRLKLHHQHIERRQRMLTYAIPAKAAPLLLLAAPEPTPVAKFMMPRPTEQPLDPADRLPRVPESVNYIVSVVADQMGVSYPSVRSPSNRYPVVKARHMAAWVCLTVIQSAGLSWLGRCMLRNHSTVRASFKVIERRRDEMRPLISAIGAAIGVPDLAEMKRATFQVQSKKDQAA